MDSKRNIASYTLSCLLCNNLVETANQSSHKSLSLSSPHCLEDKQIRLFLLRNILELPKPFTGFGIDNHKLREDEEHCSKGLLVINTCEQCKESIKLASIVYSETRELARKFRGIQRKIVEDFKKCSSGSSCTPASVTDNDDTVAVVKYYRKLVKDCDYNGFGFPFIVHDDEDPEEGDEVVVKQEVEEEINEKQEILLIFPEQNDDHVNQTDSEEDEESEYHCSQVDSEEEDDDDFDNQVSEDNSEDDEDDQMDSVEEEDEDEKQNLDPPQDIQVEKKRKRFSEPEAEPTNLLSSYICKMCLKRFPTKKKLGDHHKSAHPPPPPARQPIKPRKILENPAKPPKRVGRPPKPRPNKPGKLSIPFPCPLCPRSLESFKKLRNHLKNLHPNNQVPFNQLIPSSLKTLPPEEQAKFLRITEFELEYPHIICQSDSNGKFPCPYTDPSPCPKICKKRVLLHAHIRSIHLKVPMITCTWSEGSPEGQEGGGPGPAGPICGKPFFNRDSYSEHLDEHRGTPKYKCEHENCGMAFYRSNTLVRHQQRTHLGVKFICDQCGHETICQEYLNSHITQNHKQKSPVKRRPYKRKIKTGTGSEDDDDGEGIICDLCGKFLKNKLTLKGHLEIVHGNEPGRHCCHLCDKRFRMITHLNIHLWARHRFKVEGFEPKEKVAREDKFQCGVVGCRMTLMTKGGLERHGKKVHGEDGKKPGPWNCKVCGKNFFQKAKWEHCERTHENKESRPEKCEICGKGFPTQHHLKFHLKHTHKIKVKDSRWPNR